MVIYEVLPAVRIIDEINTIELAFCIDNGYATHLAALITSIQKNLSTDYKINCHVFW